MEQWHVIVEFAPLADADLQWNSWCASHDVSALAKSDVRIDTGRGAEGQDLRRYSVRESVVATIVDRDSR